MITKKENLLCLLLLVCVFLFLTAIQANAFLFADSSSDAASADSDGTTSSMFDKSCEKTRNESEKVMMDVSNAVYDEYVPDANQYLEAAKDCFDGISGAFGSFSLGVPSMNDILGMACDYAVSAINEEIAGLNAHYNMELLDEYVNSSPYFDMTELYDYGYSVSGVEIAGDVWEDVNN